MAPNADDLELLARQLIEDCRGRNMELVLSALVLAAAVAISEVTNGDVEAESEYLASFARNLAISLANLKEEQIH